MFQTRIAPQKKHCGTIACKLKHIRPHVSTCCAKTVET
jgi:hypothetical protein